MKKREYNETYVMLPCAGSREDRQRWRITALQLGLTFEEYVRRQMDAVFSGGSVQPIKQTADNKAVTGA